MSHRIVVLSIDVCEAVIDHASDHVASLRQLSLVCSTFQPRARYHLFSSIRIRSVEQMQSSPKFLDTHPWLPPLVQKVSLSPGPLSGDHWYRVQNVPLLDIAPVQILSRLPNLRTWKLELIGSPLTTGGPWLSFHRSALSCYQRYGSRIRNLELSCLPFDDLSDFTGLISAFAGIQNMTCSYVRFRIEAERKPFVYHPGPSMLARSLKITSLSVSDSVDFRAVGYLLASSGATLNNLVLTLKRDATLTADSFEQLEKMIPGMWFSQLSSVTLIIPHYGNVPRNHDPDPDLSQSIHYAIRILGRVQRAHLSDVRVEFKLHSGSIAIIGACLSQAGAALAACQALEEALLAFRLCRVFCHSPVSNRRAGRVEFWSSAFRRAFPNLSERGLLVLNAGAKGDDVDPVGHEGRVGPIVASYDSKWIATASEDGTIIVWDVERGTIVQEWLAHRGSGVCALAFSPDSPRLVSAGGEGSDALAVWDLGPPSNLNGAGVRRTAALAGHTLAITACVWSPDGALIASGSVDGTVRVWDALTFQERDVVDDVDPPHLHTVPLVFSPGHLQFSPDSRYLAWRSDSRTNGCGCTIWRPLSGEEPKWLPAHPSISGEDIRPIDALSFDPEGRRIATAHSPTREPCTVRIWDPATGAMLAVLAGHSQPVTGISFSPDGKSILSASLDGSVKIWDAGSGIATASLHVHEKYTATPAPIVKACYSPDGKFVATIAMSSSTVQLWRMDNASCVVEFIEHRGADVSQVVFSPDGELLASGDVDGIVVIRRFPSSLRY